MISALDEARGRHLDEHAEPVLDGRQVAVRGHAAQLAQHARDRGVRRRPAGVRARVSSPGRGGPRRRSRSQQRLWDVLVGVGSQALYLVIIFSFSFSAGSCSTFATALWPSLACSRAPGRAVCLASWT